jgi:hypothetical protein
VKPKRIQRTQDHSRRITTKSGAKIRRQESKVLKDSPSCSHRLQSEFKVRISSLTSNSPVLCKNLRNPKSRSRTYYVESVKLRLKFGKRKRRGRFFIKSFKKKMEFEFSGGGAAGNHHAGAIKLAGEDEDLPPSS